jgi:hypothetical protein
VVTARNHAAELPGGQEALVRLRNELTIAAGLISPRLLEARTQRTLPTGVGPLDLLLGGGLPRGKLVEVIGGTGRAALALATVTQVTRRGELAVYIDAAGALGARQVEAVGVVLERLLVVRPSRDARRDPFRRALSAAEVALAASAFSLVVIDLALMPAFRKRGKERPLTDAVWLRLARAAEKTDSVALVLSPSRGRPMHRAGAFASLTLELHLDRVRWSGEEGARLLDGAEVGLQISRSKLGRSGAKMALGLSAMKLRAPEGTP